MTKAKGTEIHTDLLAATKVGHSTNGNPTWELHTTAGFFKTQTDAACSYDVDNVRRKIPDGGSLPVILKATRSGRVWSIEIDR
jgi:hypothetical protein